MPLIVICPALRLYVGTNETPSVAAATDAHREAHQSRTNWMCTIHMRMISVQPVACLSEVADLCAVVEHPLLTLHPSTDEPVLQTSPSAAPLSPQHPHPPQKFSSSSFFHDRRQCKALQSAISSCQDYLQVALSSQVTMTIARRRTESVGRSRLSARRDYARPANIT